MDLLTVHPSGATLLCALLFYILVRRRAIIALVKPRSERTETEIKLVRKGLFTAIVFDLLVSVPSGVVLMRILVAPWVLSHMPVSIMTPELTISVHGLLGIASYPFPIVPIRTLATIVADKALEDLARLRSGRKDDDR
jgi:hypothetical protein